MDISRQKPLRMWLFRVFHSIEMPIAMPEHLESLFKTDDVSVFIHLLVAALRMGISFEMNADRF